jgi:hypothetical protein
MFSTSRFVGAPSSDVLEVGEVEVVALDDVRVRSGGLLPFQGTFVVTNRYLRYSGKELVLPTVANGALPDFAGTLGRKQELRLAIPLSDIRGARAERSFGIFQKISIALRHGEELVIEVGMRDVTQLLQAMAGG